MISEKRSFNGSWGKQPFGEKKSDNFSSRKNFDKGQVSTEGTELVDGTVAARVDVLGKVIPRRAIEDKLSKLVKTSISVDGKCFGYVGRAQSEKNSLAQSSQDLRVDSGNVDETEVSSGILPEKAQEHIEDSQRNITSCRNEVGTLGTKDEEVTAEMDKGIMVADSFRSEQECCAELALVGRVEQLPAPGNRSNERRYRERIWQRRRRKGLEQERREGDEKNRGREKVDTAERCIIIL
ncbi:uncharacterized protein TNCV_3623761 [Trichonephila clavipes]|nr:uncharacterized protein TNCV_3623761 [Trichonephila clavipes]